VTARGLATATLAAAAFVALAAPAWPCGPPASMDNNGGATQGNANDGGAGGQAQGDNNGGGSNWNNNNGGGGGDRSGDSGNGGAENARQGASGQANSDLNGDDDNGGRRSSGGDNQNSANYANQIGSLGQQQAAADSSDCQALRRELDVLATEEPEDERIYKRAIVTIGRSMQMPSDKIDGLIADEKARLDADRARAQQINHLAAGENNTVEARATKRGSPLLNFLLDMKAARMAGLGEDGMQRRANVVTARLQDFLLRVNSTRQQAIRDLQNRIANLNCNANAPAADQRVPFTFSSPSPSQ
jgi:hypothetical protein